MSRCSPPSKLVIPERITAHVDYHIGHAWREVGKLVRELTPPADSDAGQAAAAISFPTSGVSV